MGGILLMVFITCMGDTAFAEIVFVVYRIKKTKNKRIYKHGNEKGRTHMQTSPATHEIFQMYAFAYIKNQQSVKEISDYIIVHSSINRRSSNSINKRPLVVRAYLVILILIGIFKGVGRKEF